MSLTSPVALSFLLDLPVEVGLGGAIGGVKGLAIDRSHKLPVSEGVHQEIDADIGHQKTQEHLGNLGIEVSLHHRGQQERSGVPHRKWEERQTHGEGDQPVAVSQDMKGGLAKVSDSHNDLVGLADSLQHRLVVGIKDAGTLSLLFSKRRRR